MRRRFFISFPPLLLAITLATFVTNPVLSFADERKSVYGTWGTDKQCAREPIKQGGTVLAEPFEISRGWLRQGQLWCKLNWFPLEKREDGVFTGAHAQCGEDSIRDYFLGIELEGEELTLRWDFPHKNGPLNRCPVS